MRMANKLVAVAALVMGAVSVSSVLYAQTSDDHAKGGMMGPGMMNMMGQMSQMMEQCNQMMQRTSAKQNEQRKDNLPGEKGDSTKQR